MCATVEILLLFTDVIFMSSTIFCARKHMKLLDHLMRSCHCISIGVRLKACSCFTSQQIITPPEAQLT